MTRAESHVCHSGVSDSGTPFGKSRRGHAPRDRHVTRAVVDGGVEGILGLFWRPTPLSPYNHLDTSSLATSIRINQSILH